MSGPVRRLLVTAATVLLVAGLLVTVVGSDTAMRVVGSTPSEGQTFTSPPREVTLTLSLAVDEVLSHVTVVGSDGQPVDAGPVQTGPGPVLRRSVRIDNDGSYRLAYHVIGEDGGTASGTIRFAVGTAGPADRDAPIADGTDPHRHHGVDPLSAVLLVANLVAVVVVLVLLMIRPSPRRRGSGQRGG